MRRRFLFLSLLLVAWSIPGISSAQEEDKIPSFTVGLSVLNGYKALKVQPIGRDGSPSVFTVDSLDFRLNDEPVKGVCSADFCHIPLLQKTNQLLLVEMPAAGQPYRLVYLDAERNRVHTIPFWLVILPPLLAIAFALFFREVLVSLFAGIWIGAFIANGLQLRNFFDSLFDVVDTYVVGALADSDHVAIILFSTFIGGMVAVISRNGGMAGVVEALSKYANSARRAQFITWLLGIAIFFDDYANSLIVGNTVRPVTDRFRISREKLAYIVDSTAAPVAAIAFITTWIGAELGYIEDALSSTGLADVNVYSIFIGSLKYALYPVLTLLFIVLLIATGRDFGPMLRAERRARESGILDLTEGQDTDGQQEQSALTPKEGITHRAAFAVIPVLSLIAVVVFRLVWYDGAAAHWGQEGSFFSRLQAVVGESDSYSALMWGSTVGVIISVLISVVGGKLRLQESLHSLVAGFKTMMTAIVILVLAWSLASITSELHTARFLISQLPEGASPFYFPLYTFILAALVSFATGSSWGTMAILYPICLPITWFQAQALGLPVEEMMPIIYNVTAVVLAGSVFGDHCSPISDTTVLSSLACQCNHIEHVRTQLPYAITVGIVSVFCGGLLFAWQVPWWAAFLIGTVLVALSVRYGGVTMQQAQKG